MPKNERGQSGREDPKGERPNKGGEQRKNQGRQKSYRPLVPNEDKKLNNYCPIEQYIEKPGKPATKKTTRECLTKYICQRTKKAKHDSKGKKPH